MPSVEFDLNELFDLYDALTSYIPVVRKREMDLRLCWGGEYHEDVIVRLRKKIREECIHEMKKEYKNG